MHGNLPFNLSNGTPVFTIKKKRLTKEYCTQKLHCKTSFYLEHSMYTVKQRFTSFPSPAGMSLTKLPLGRNNSVMTSLFPPRESLVVTSRLGRGNSRTFFYGVETLQMYKSRMETVQKEKQTPPPTQFAHANMTWWSSSAEQAPTQRGPGPNSVAACGVQPGCWPVECRSQGFLSLDVTVWGL